MKKNILKIAGLLLLTVSLSGCSVWNKFLTPADNTESWDAAQLYEQARDDVRQGSWKDARKHLAFIQQRYPYSVYAQQALIDEAYVNWKDDEPEVADAVINRFLQSYPGHPSTDYMLYLKGLITFTPPAALINYYAGQDPADRDPVGLRRSYNAFSELIKLYPESRYAVDARQRINWLVNTIAEHEISVALYNLNREAYVAAINRASTVITDFIGVNSVQEKALYIMYKGYEGLSQPENAQDIKRLLVQNFPDSKILETGIERKYKWFNPLAWFN